MGGSGISGDLLAAVAGPLCPVPIMVHKDEDLPGFVGSRTLVLAVSCSGGTAETNAAAGAAADAGARLVVVSQGGALAELADAVNAPHLPVPAAIPMPRAAIGALSVPLLLVLEDTGLLPGARAMVDGTVVQLRRRRDALRLPDSSAERLARAIGRTVPIVYGAGGIGAVAAYRWKGQLNENAKVPAFWNRLPELCHNEVAGWGQHGDVTRQVFTLIQLRHGFETPSIERRYALVDDLMVEIVAAIHDVSGAGASPLAQLFDLVLQGDLVSLHLAAQSQVDPGPIPALDIIKAGLTS
jgi:glucose/mannose-6-phosphate isomerase